MPRVVRITAYDNMALNSRGARNERWADGRFPIEMGDSTPTSKTDFKDMANNYASILII